MQKLEEDKSNNQQNLQIIGGMQLNYLKVIPLIYPQVCYH